MSDDDLPPVGATVTDADGTRWVYPTWRDGEELLDALAQLAPKEGA